MTFESFSDFEKIVGILLNKAGWEESVRLLWGNFP